MNKVKVAKQILVLAKSLMAKKEKYKNYTIETSGDNFYVTDPSGHRAFGEVPASVETAKKWIDQDIREKGSKHAVAHSLMKLAKQLVSMEFDTEEEKKKYQEEHDVRPGTKLTVTKSEKPSGKPLPSPSSGSRKVKSIGGVSPQEYASQWGASGLGQARAHFYNYGSGKQTKDKAFYKEFMDGKGGIMNTMRDVSDSLNRGEKRWDKSDLDDLVKLRGHVQAEMEELGSSSKGTSKDEHSHVLKDGTKVRIYDAGEDSGADRYTAVLDSPDWDTSASPGMKAMLGFSGSPDHPQGVSQFSSGKEGRHLGKLVKFTDLPKDLQNHVIRRVSE